ncbi:hypothetical protein QE152_g9187 [Popillia japonica]|uniref:Uncharacterized protein n=1 Tax=Popillia japonica TaxID=7064 RepID=A0AAW1LXQ4_POPJA
MLNHPGVPMTIYDIAGVVGKAFPLALTPSNIIKGFERTGIYPFNFDIFDESEFLSSYVTDRAQARNGIRKGKKQAKSTALTDTPNKEEIELAHGQKIQKIRLREMKQRQKEHKPNKTAQQMKNNLKRKLFIISSSSESDVELEKICNDSTDDSITEEKVPNESLSEGNFVLVKFPTKKSIRFYVAKIVNIENLDYYLTYLTKGLGRTFTYPEKKDDDVKEREDIVMELPKPEILGGTERAFKKFKFNVDLTDFSIY